MHQLQVPGLRAAQNWYLGGGIAVITMQDTLLHHPLKERLAADYGNLSRSLTNQISATRSCSFAQGLVLMPLDKFSPREDRFLVSLVKSDMT